MRRFALVALALGVWLIAATTPSPTHASSSNVSKVAGGTQHTCALTTTGGVKCWGANYDGQLGDGTQIDSPTAVGVSGLTSGVFAVAAGYEHTCALTTAGGARCWGYNSNGQVGIGSGNLWITTPAVPTGLSSGVLSISAGYAHTCAVLIGGTVKCWGYNSSGQLGDGTTTSRTSPVATLSLPQAAVSVYAGGFHTCALLSGGGVACWGLNTGGQLGVGTQTGPEACPSACSTAPVVAGITGASQLTAGAAHTCAIASGGAKCWGANDTGQLGDGTFDARSSPVDVSSLTTGVTRIIAGGLHTCARDGSGLWCWGRNASGELGDGTTTGSNVPVMSLGAGSDFGAGYHHTCAISSAALSCWGRNEYGQLGNGATANSSSPVDVLGLMAQPALDSDGDGCTDKVETTTSPGSEQFGGRRNPASFWDFYDTPDESNVRNGEIDLFGDIFGVASRFGANDAGGSAPVNRTSDPLSAPPSAPAYHPAFDRSAPPLQGDAWDAGPPDGIIDLFSDIFGVANQFGHHCN